MIYVTIIIVVTLICATRIYPLWLRHDCKRTRKALKLVHKLREENCKLRKELNKTYDEWFEDFSQRQKSQDRAWDLLCDLAEKLNIKLK